MPWWSCNEFAVVLSLAGNAIYGEGEEQGSGKLVQLVDGDVYFSLCTRRRSTMI